MRKYTVIVDWTDADVADSDEVTVSAGSAKEAIRKARETWNGTIGAKWPHCRVERVWVLHRA
jgi:hypothetical protein